MTLRVNSHGGECCGIRHVYGFYDYDYDHFNLDEIYDELYNLALVQTSSKYTNDFSSRLVEVVLTNAQPLEFHQACIDIGFVVVNWFVNHNSGNTCMIYHIARDPESGSLPIRTQAQSLALVNRTLLTRKDIDKQP